MASTAAGIPSSSVAFTIRSPVQMASPSVVPIQTSPRATLIEDVHVPPGGAGGSLDAIAGHAADAAAPGAQPQSTGAIAQQGVDVVDRKTVACRVPSSRSAAQPVHAAFGAEPHRAVGILDHRVHAIVSQPVLRREAPEHPALEPAHASGMRADPHRSLSVLQQRLDDPVGQPIARFVGDEAAVPEAMKTAGLRTDPQVAVAVLGEGVDHVVGRRVRQQRALQSAITHAHDATTGRAQPQVPVAVVEHGHHGHRGEAGTGRHDVEASTVPDAERSIAKSCAERAAEHANPQLAGAVLVDGAHAAGRHPVARSYVDEPGALEAMEAGVRTDPERSSAVDAQCEHVVARQAGVLAQQREAVACETGETGAAQSHPQRALRIARDRLHARRRQSLLGTVAGEPSVAMSDQAPAVGARPETAIRRFVEREDEGIGDGWRIGAVEDGEAESVESNKAFVRAEPEIAVSGLGDRVHGILGKALVGGPGLVHVPVERL